MRRRVTGPDAAQGGDEPPEEDEEAEATAGEEHEFAGCGSPELNKRRRWRGGGLTACAASSASQETASDGVGNKTGASQSDGGVTSIQENPRVAALSFEPPTCLRTSIHCTGLHRPQEPYETAS